MNLFIEITEEMTIVRDMAAALEGGKSLSEILESMAISTKHDNPPTNEDDCNQETSVSRKVFEFVSACDSVGYFSPFSFVVSTLFFYFSG